MNRKRSWLGRLALLVASGALASFSDSALAAGAHQTKTLSNVDKSNIDNIPSSIIRFVPENLFAVDFVSDKVGWAAGYYGTVLRTTNGGASWSRYGLSSHDLIRRIDFLDHNVGWAVTSRGKIIKSEDGGVTWTVAHEAPGIYLRDVHFVSSSEGWAIGHEATILHTVDGGVTWKAQSISNYSGRDLPRLNGITSLSPAHLVVVGEFGVIAETIDGGEVWSVISGRQTQVTYTDVSAASGGAVAVGLGGAVAVVNFPVQGVPDVSGQRSRVALRSGQASHHLFSIDINEHGNGVAVGQNGIYSINSVGELSSLPLPEAVPSYAWFGGVARRSTSDEFVCVGVAGAILNVNPGRENSEVMIQW